MKFKTKSGLEVEMIRPKLKDRARLIDMLDTIYDLDDDNKAINIRTTNTLAVAVEWCEAVLPDDFDLETLNIADVMEISKAASEISTVGK